MASIVGVNTLFPKYRYAQSEIMGVLERLWPEHEAVLKRLNNSSGVHYRNVFVPLDRYGNFGGFQERNDVFVKEVPKLLEQAALQLQKTLGFDWQDVGFLVSTTVTGIAVPSIEARMMNLLPLPNDVVRTPLFGLGCLGGVASLNRAYLQLKANPKKLAIVFAAEACSLTIQHGDSSMANMVASSLFGDGVAVVVLAGSEHPLYKQSKLKIRRFRSRFYPNSEDVMGWKVVDGGFQVVLSGSVPDVVKQNVRADLDTFLVLDRLTRSNIGTVISHPGGPKVLLALAEAIGKPEAEFRHSWDSLRENGNMSSVSVLDVLCRALMDATSPVGQALSIGPALMLAMGPGFNAEYTLLDAS